MLVTSPTVVLNASNDKKIPNDSFAIHFKFQIKHSFQFSVYKRFYSNIYFKSRRSKACSHLFDSILNSYSYICVPHVSLSNACRFRSNSFITPLELTSSVHIVSAHKF